MSCRRPLWIAVLAGLCVLAWDVWDRAVLSARETAGEAVQWEIQNSPAFAAARVLDGAERATPPIVSGRQQESAPLPDALQEVMEGSALSASWLQAHGFDPGSIALQRLHGLLLGHVSLPDRATGKKIGFGPAGALVMGQDQGAVLSQQERYIQAALPSDVLNTDSVLVRWRNASDNVVVELSAQTIPPNLNVPIPVWKYSTGDWPPGRYRVEVISPDGDLSVLAAGEFEIATPHAQLTPFAWTASTPAQP